MIACRWWGADGRWDICGALSNAGGNCKRGRRTDNPRYRMHRRQHRIRIPRGGNRRRGYMRRRDRLRRREPRGQPNGIGERGDRFSEGARHHRDIGAWQRVRKVEFEPAALIGLQDGRWRSG